MKRIIIIFIFFVLFSFVKTESVLADRLLLGVDFIGYAYVNNVDSASDEGGVQWIKQCKPDQEKTPKTGDYVTDECGDEGAEDAFGTEGIYPNLSLEINFGKPSTGWGLMFVLKPTNKNRTKLVNYPNDNESIIIDKDIRFIGIPIMYTWGDPELGKNGNMAIRFGWGPSLLYYDPLIIETKDETITKRGFEEGFGLGYLFFSWDWGGFALIYQQLLQGNGIKVDEIKNNNGEPIKISSSWNSMSLNYSWYF